METKLIVLLIIFLTTLLGVTFMANHLKLVIKLLINSAVGICFMVIANYILKSTGLYVGVNEFTSLFVGFLGVPGLICLYILKMIL